MTSTEQSAHRGRPRSKAAHAQVLNAASELLHHTAYTSLTVEQIAAQAGVSKQTIYRWWGNKAEVVLEALLGPEPHFTFAPMPSTQDLLKDLTAWITGTLHEALTEDKIAMTRSLLSAALTSVPETMDRLDPETAWSPTQVTRRLQQAIEDGEIPDHANITAAASALTDPVVFRMITGVKPSKEWSQNLVRFVVRGLQQP